MSAEQIAAVFARRADTCALCAQHTWIKGRGLCNRCYQRARSAGKLDGYARILRTYEEGLALARDRRQSAAKGIAV